MGSLKILLKNSLRSENQNLNSNMSNCGNNIHSKMLHEAYDGQQATVVERHGLIVKMSKYLLFRFIIYLPLFWLGEGLGNFCVGL